MIQGNTERENPVQTEKNEIYDMAIIGGGPAGLTAAVYSSRAILKTILLEKLGPGGQMAVSDVIENYPGFPENINGFDLSQKMAAQVEKFGARIENAEVSKIERNKDGLIFDIKTDGPVYRAKCVIIATGVKARRLGVNGEKEYIGRGISFCATCDAALYRDKTVAVIGGGDSAMDESYFLTRFVKKVYIIHRRDTLRAEKVLQKRAFENPKIEFIWDTVVDEVLGDSKIRSLKLKNVKNESFSFLDIDGMFLYIGFLPDTIDIEGIKKDGDGYIITDENMRTSEIGIYAAGDCRSKPLRQISTAINDGAIAAVYAGKYLEELR